MTRKCFNNVILAYDCEGNERWFRIRSKFSISCEWLLDKNKSNGENKKTQLGFLIALFEPCLVIGWGAGQSEFRLSDLPLDRVKAAEGEKEVGDEAENDNQWFMSYDSYLFICIFNNFYDKAIISSKIPELFTRLSRDCNLEILE